MDYTTITDPFSPRKRLQRTPPSGEGSAVGLDAQTDNVEQMLDALEQQDHLKDQEDVTTTICIRPVQEEPNPFDESESINVAQAAASPTPKNSKRPSARAPSSTMNKMGSTRPAPLTRQIQPVQPTLSQTPSGKLLRSALSMTPSSYSRMSAAKKAMAPSFSANESGTLVPPARRKLPMFANNNKSNQVYPLQTPRASGGSGLVGKLAGSTRLKRTAASETVARALNGPPIAIMTPRNVSASSSTRILRPGIVQGDTLAIVEAPAMILPVRLVDGREEIPSVTFDLRSRVTLTAVWSA